MFAKNTVVPVQRSRQEIEQLLERAKAKQYGTGVDYEILKARVQFRLHDRIVRFVVDLPDPNKFSARNRGKFEQLERQKWRALLLVIKAKLESVESQIETFEEAFLANIVLPNDQTVSQAVRPHIAAAYTGGKMPKALMPAPDEATP
jgi:hypothetical protein